MDDEKKIEFAKGIIYRPCKFCYSLEYDQADAEVKDTYEGQVYEPEGCDQCCFGSKAPIGSVVH